MDNLFPNGIQSYLVGGMITGAGIGLIYLLTGRIAGLSSFLTAAQSWWSKRPFFQQPSMLDERRWKSVLVVALIAGAALYTVLIGQPYITALQPWRLLIGGVIVGMGTRIARGCTSGHGICGISALAAPSLAATMMFMGVAIVTAKLVALTGLTP